MGRILDPKDKLFCPGTESIVLAGSLEPARIPFRFARAILEPKGGYRFADSLTRIQIHHTDTNTRIKVIGSRAKSAFGLVGCPLVIADEPGAWETTGAQMMHDAITTSLGKPGSPLKVIYVGTLAAAESGWYHDLISGGSQPGIYVQALQGNPKKWDQWPEIRRCNPLTNISPEFRKELLSMAIENMTLLAMENVTLFGMPHGGSGATGAGRSERIWSARITGSLRVPSALQRPPGRRSGGWPWRVRHGGASGSCCPGC